MKGERTTYEWAIEFLNAKREELNRAYSKCARNSLAEMR